MIKGIINIFKKSNIDVDKNIHFILTLLLVCVHMYIIYIYYIYTIIPREEFIGKIIPFEKSKKDKSIANENSDIFPYKNEIKNAIERYFEKKMIMTSLNRIFSQDNKYYMSVSLVDTVTKDSVLMRVRMTFNFMIDGIDIINQNEIIDSKIQSANSVVNIAKYEIN